MALVAIIFAFSSSNAQEFQRVYGTALDNSFTKVVQDAAGNFYVLGQDEAVNGALQRATVTRLDANGLHQWTLSLNFASLWHDAVLTPSGELMLVGQTLPSDPTAKGIMARVTSTGSFARLRTYDEAGRDLFTRIVRQSGTFPYYVIGAQYDGGSSPTFEDVVLFNIDQDLNVNWKKRYYHPGDDEYFRDFEVIGVNTLAMAGNWADGLIFISDNNGNMSAGVQLPNRLVRDIHRELFGGVYAASINGGNSEAYIEKFDANLLLQWEYRINGLTSISQVWEGLPGSGELYAVGAGTFGNQQRTVVVKLTETINGLSVNWVKYLTVGNGYMGGSAWFLSSVNLAFTDARTIPGGFGQSCAFISVSDLDMGTCDVGNTTTTLTQTDPFPNSPQPFPLVESAPTTMGVNSVEASAINWQQQVACSVDPCTVNIVVTPMSPPCGQVQVCVVTTGSGPYSYQWCNGSNTQCYITQINPCTPTEFCVSVTCADGTVASDTEIYTFTDITPPVAQCLGIGVILDPILCTAPITPAMIDGGSSDNCGIASMVLNMGQVSGCGLHPVTLTVTDYCGNMSICTAQVQAIESTPPAMTCPPNIAKNCDDKLTPADCGAATAVDNCDPNPVISYSDVTSGIFPCDGTIQRTWTAEDNCGNVVSCVQTIVVIDNIPPTVTCPPTVQVIATNPDTCVVVVNNLQLLSLSDNCSTPSIQYQVTGATTETGQSNASGTTFYLGLSTVTYMATDECGNTSSCSFNVEVECEGTCPGNLIENPGFTIGAVAGNMSGPGASSNWQKGYGNPEVLTDFGCGDAGYIKLTGDKAGGDAIYQQLSTPIKKGQVYEVTACIRATWSGCPGLPNCIPYVKYRLAAFNNSLPQTGNHPQPNSDLAIIDISGRVPICDDWTQFVFHRWRAPKDFDNIAISVENSESIGSGKISEGLIDNICLTEVNDSIPCYLVDYDSLGNPIPPFGQIDTNCPILEDSVDIFMGSVDDIYAYCNPMGLDTFYADWLDSCASIGGELPEDLLDYIEDDSTNIYLMDSLGINDSILNNDINNFLDSLELESSSLNLVDSIMNLGAFAFDCRKLPPQGPAPDDTDSPFNGMDIIFVHGLRLNPIIERATLPTPGSLTLWPHDRPEFYDGGYWKIGAYNTWNPHTAKYLNTEVNPATSQVSHPQINGPIYSNRYLVVSHPATQNFVYGAHSVMEQIANAMLNGAGVVNCDPNEQRPKNTFGHNGFVIISHSDGAPLTDIVLTTSQLTQAPPLSFMLGDVSFIAERCKLHVAIQGAFGGSNYATVLLMAVSPSFQHMKPLAEQITGVPIVGSHGWLFTSELLDMALTQHRWGATMNQVPVCVLTIAGGHPTDFGEDIGQIHIPSMSRIFNHAINFGFQDGVLPIESQTASPFKRHNYPNVYLPLPGLLSLIGQNERIFDMGINKERAVRYYMDQKLDLPTSGNLAKIPFAASGCIPWLSPTGMVQPVASPRQFGVPGFDPLLRYNNHYSFIQSTSDHYQGSRGPFPNYPDYERTSDVNAPNCEESRVITSSDVYTKCGVSYSYMAKRQIEIIRGKKITFRLWPTKKTITRWIWKRTYHVLGGHKGTHQLDYLYQSVLK